MSKTQDETIIGIDLGTMFSCIAIIRANKVEVITDPSDGSRIIPSIVCYKDKWLYGNSARKNMTEYAESTMFESKRLIGLKFNNKQVQRDIKDWQVKIIEDPETKKPQYVIKVENKENKYFAEDVSSMILKYLKKNAETFTNSKINKAVITVPAHFNTFQRQATVKAAELAGLEVIKIINEPTAAAIAYAETINTDKKEKKVLIFDIGGGTFDVSILKIKNNEYYVLSSCGESHLGGEDFNQRLEDYVISEIKKIKEFKDIDFNNKDDKKIKKSLNRIKMEVENVKIQLSAEIETSFSLDGFYNGKDLELKITRSTYEKLCKDLWEKCIKKIGEALELAKLKKENIDEIILVGGSVRTPKIQEMVKNYFGKEPLQNVNVDEVVAIGATLAPKLDIKTHDIITKTIGIEAVNGKMMNIIDVGTVLPVRGKTLNYSRGFILGGKNPNNLQVIKIYEGNDPIANKNQYLGKFNINLNKNDKEKKITIIMNIDHNSILSVIGKVNDEKNNELEIKLVFDEDNYEFLNEEIKINNIEDLVLGIDLGTVSSCSAIFINDYVEVIQEDISQEKIIPSVVCYKDNNQILIGKNAIRNKIEYLQSTIFESKRLFGYKFKDKEIEEDIKKWPVKIIEDPKTKKPQYVININNKEKKLFPENIIEELLKYIKENAENYITKKTKLKTKIKKSVISFPINYTEERKKGIIEIGKKIGFEKIELIEEPIAAGIAYGFIHKSDKERNVLIFDIGGGNCGVCILKIKNLDFKILSKCGKGFLGGIDFEKKLIDYVINEIKKKEEFKNLDFNKKDKVTFRALLKIKDETERTIFKLSDDKIVNFKIEDLDGNNDFSIKINRENFVKLCDDLLKKCFEIITEAISKANLKKGNIDEIILVSTTFRLPELKLMIKDYFGKEPLRNINIDEVIAQGAALFKNPKIHIK